MANDQKVVADKPAPQQQADSGLTVEAIKYIDFKGKETYHLKITRQGKEPHYVNIGEKTFKAISQL